MQNGYRQSWKKGQKVKRKDNILNQIGKRVSVLIKRVKQQVILIMKLEFKIFGILIGILYVGLPSLFSSGNLRRGELEISTS